MRVQAGAAGDYWMRLTATDFLTSSFAFAALGVLCVFPVLAIASNVTGSDVREAIIVRMGLTDDAANDVNALYSSERSAASSLDVFSAAILVAGALGMASTLQTWYRKIYDQPREKSILKIVAYQAAGIVAFCSYLSVNVLILDAARRSAVAR